MLNISNKLLRTKLYVFADVRENKKRYLASLACFVLGVVLALIFVFSGAVEDLPDSPIVSEILHGEGIFYSFLRFLPSFLFLIIFTIVFSCVHKLRYLFYVALCLNVRKVFVWGIGLIFNFGFWGIIDFIIFFIVAYIFFLFCIVFYYNCNRILVGALSPCKYRARISVGIIKDFLIMAGIILLIQLVYHMLVFFILKLLF